MNTPLHDCIERHLDALISGPETDIEVILEKCLFELSLNWSKPGHVEQSLISIFRDLRIKHPQGMSKRQSNRKRKVEKLVKLLLPIREAKEREWWKELAIHPITAVVEKLRSIPDEYLDMALDRLLQLPASYPHILDKRIHDFLRRVHSQIERVDHVIGPMGVAYISYLVANKENVIARDLLKRFPEHDRSALGALVAYLRFLVDQPTDLTGSTDYSTLSSEDLFLGACYYGGKVAASTLANQTDWDYKSLQYALKSHELNDFKVGGLQPRIAELAFHRVYYLLHGANAEAEDQLHDLNLECLQRLVPPWKLEFKSTLPAADWDANGEQYDVKSNLFYRSDQSQSKNGLRGFFIKRSDIEHHSFPGILFTGTDNESCSWVYIGEYQQTEMVAPIGDRVHPFCFRLPDSERFGWTITDCDPSLGMKLLIDPWLRISWQLALGNAISNQEEQTIAESLLCIFVERCIQEMADTGVFLEYALWKGLTETTLDACCKYDHEIVQSYLILSNKLISSQTLPIRLPRIGNTPILCRWITEVLQPLSRYWHRIQFPDCQNCGSQDSTVRLHITRMTSEGTIYGLMICEHCSHEINEVTLLTHCHNCSHYPLIVGKNPICTGCGGLVCEWHHEEKRCKCCKKDCGQGQNILEKLFSEDSGL